MRVVLDTNVVMSAIFFSGTPLKIVLHRGLPFAVQFPAKRLANAATMTDAELDAEVSKGFDDIAAGRKKPLSAVVSSLTREFAL